MIRDGTSGDDPNRPASAADVAALREALEALTRRVDALDGGTRVASPPASEHASQALEPQAVEAPQEPPVAAPSSAPPVSSGEAPSPPARTAREAWRIGPLRNVSREALPVVAMGAAGGVALLMGLLYFVWYSIQQGWISPRVRLSAVAAFGVLALFQAWRMAPRGHRTVAAALGGAGLGGLFGAALVARHVHGFFGPGTTFVLLVLAATLGFVVAVHRRLRLLASLAAWGAFATPLVVGSDSSSLHELMTYQLVVAGFLYTVEHRRGWPELGHFAVFSSWALLSVAMLPSFGTGRWDAWSWAWVYLVVGQVQAWNLLRRGSLAPLHGAPRVWINGFLAWVLAADASVGEHSEAYTTLAMAVWNGAYALSFLRFLRTPGERAGERSEKLRRLAVLAALAGGTSIAWLQLFAFAPMRLAIDSVGLQLWWTAMAALAVLVHVRWPRVVTLLPIVPPYLAAVAWSLGHADTEAIPGGFLLAALPLAVGLFPSARTLAASSAARELWLAVCLVVGAVVWLALSERHFADRDPRGGWVPLACLVAATGVTLRAVAEPSAARIRATLLLLLGVGWVGVLHAADAGLFQPVHVPSFASTGRAHGIAAFVGVAVLAHWTGFGCRRRADDENGLATVADYAGVVRPLAWLLAAMLVVSGVVPRLTSDVANAGSLTQAGWSVCWAVGGLTLLLRGLFARRSIWRRAGMVLLFTTAAKLVFVDLVEVSMVWRVLSFVGLGVCLLLGAYAYRRLGVWIEREAEAA